VDSRTYSIRVSGRMAQGLTFSSKDDEIRHWKQLATDFQQKYEEAKDELEDFTTSSRELEAEMETQIEQLESQNREFRTSNDKLRTEYENLKAKFEKLQVDSRVEITDLQNELSHTDALKNELQKYIRELEQSNDDLERTKRAALSSLEDFESRLNLAIERNAFLENELDDKDALSAAVQRLKDETRDLKSELGKDKRLSIPNGVSHSEEPDNDKAAFDSNKCVSVDIFTQTANASGSPLRTSAGQLNGLTPSARISALNIVGDLLRKVGLFSNEKE